MAFLKNFNSVVFLLSTLFTISTRASASGPMWVEDLLKIIEEETEL